MTRAESHVLFVLAAAALAAGCGGDEPSRAPSSRPHRAARMEAAPDASSMDAAVADAARDAGSEPPWTPPKVVPPEPDSQAEFWLSQTGLYRDIATKTLAPDLHEFEPAYTLWSDQAEKQRWMRLPEGQRIDTSDMDHWRFPIGTMLFKQFSLDGKLLETRLIMRTGPEPEDYFMGAFLWDDAESDAHFVPEGAADVRGTDHDLPKVKDCLVCHDGEAGRILGFSAVQQPAVPVQLLTAAAELPFVVPGAQQVAHALGYLHANCGHCHNLHGTAWPDTPMDLRLVVADRAPERTAIYRTTIGVEMSDRKLRRERVVARDAELSGVYYRMSTRGPNTQMPPLATELVDAQGLALVKAWIDAL